MVVNLIGSLDVPDVVVAANYNEFNDIDYADVVEGDCLLYSLLVITAYIIF